MLHENPKPFFGTPHVEGFSKRELLKKSKELLVNLFAINLKNKIIDKSKFQLIMELLEIVRFSGEKYPYLITLNFQKEGELKEVKLWTDPHYERTDNIPTALKGEIISFPDFIELSKNPGTFLSRLDAISKIIESDKIPDSELNRLCIAGTKDNILVLGRPDQDFFQGKKPIYKIINPR